MTIHIYLIHKFRFYLYIILDTYLVSEPSQWFDLAIQYLFTDQKLRFLSMQIILIPTSDCRLGNVFLHKIIIKSSCPISDAFPITIQDIYRHYGDLSFMYEISINFEYINRVINHLSRSRNIQSTLRESHLCTEYAQ